jgi:hypothetical protein
VDSLATPYSFNHGLGWQNNGFWIAEQVRTSGARIFKVNTSGIAVDTILTGTFAQGIGDIAVDGNFIWCSSYYPDYPSYPYQYAYKIDINTRQVVDTIPLRGNQTQGVTVKGDTIIYVNDNFSSPFLLLKEYMHTEGQQEIHFSHSPLLTATVTLKVCSGTDNIYG